MSQVQRIPPTPMQLQIFNSSLERQLIEIELDTLRTLALFDHNKASHRKHSSELNSTFLLLKGLLAQASPNAAWLLRRSSSHQYFLPHLPTHRLRYSDRHYTNQSHNHSSQQQDQTSCKSGLSHLSQPKGGVTFFQQLCLFVTSLA